MLSSRGFGHLTGLVLALLAASVGRASASLLTFTDRVAFNAQGVVLAPSTFDAIYAIRGDLPTRETPTGDYAGPYTQDGITYTPLATYLLLLAAGPEGTRGSGPKVIGVLDFGLPMDVTPHYTVDMLGFDATVFGSGGHVSMIVTTNLSSYNLTDISFPKTSVTAQLGFFGLVASPGEHITNVRLMQCVQGHIFGLDDCADLETSGIPGITNVTLGNTAVPEPATFGLLLSGAALIQHRRHRRRALGRPALTKAKL